MKGANTDMWRGVSGMAAPPGGSVQAHVPEGWLGWQPTKGSCFRIRCLWARVCMVAMGVWALGGDVAVCGVQPHTWEGWHGACLGAEEAPQAAGHTQKSGCCLRRGARRAQTR